MISAFRAVFLSTSPRSVRATIAWVVPVGILTLFFYRDVYTSPTPPAVVAHGVLGLNLAVNNRFCGTLSRLSTRYSPYVTLNAHREFMSRPYADLLTAEAGSVSAYCATVTAPYTLPENSLQWMAQLALWTIPNLTPDGLSNTLAAFRVAMLLLFAAAMLRAGAAVGCVAAILAAGCEILRGMTFRDTQYPFVMTLPLVHAAIYGIVALTGLPDRRRGLTAVVLSVGMGALTAFSGGARTVLAPIGAGLFLLSIAVGVRRYGPRAPRRQTAVVVTVMLLAFAAGYAAYTAVFVQPLRFKNDATVSDYAYHTFAHPLVIGLAVPGDRFTQREGIRWDDDNGVVMARRVSPNVYLLGPGYEEALLAYYRRLWARHPREMIMVYMGKLRALDEGVFKSVGAVLSRFGVPTAVPLALGRMTNGIVLLALVVGTFSIWYRRAFSGGERDARALISAFVAFAALVGMAEAFVTYSLYTTIYSSELLFFLFFALFSGLQAVVDVGAAAMRRRLVPARSS